MFIQILGIFIMFAVIGLLVLLLIYDINKDSETKYMVILCLGMFWVIVLRILWDFMWIVL